MSKEVSIKPLAWMNPDTGHIMSHADRSAMNSSGQQGMCVPLYRHAAFEHLLVLIKKWRDDYERGPTEGAIARKECADELEKALT